MLEDNQIYVIVDIELNGMIPGEQITQGMPHHSHKAIDDACGYGAILRNVLRMTQA